MRDSAGRGLPASFYARLLRQRAGWARSVAARHRRSGSAWRDYLRDASRYASEVEHRGVAATSQLRPFPQVHDRTATTDFDAHYVYQGPWALRHVAAARPAVHVDIGSYIGYLGFFAALVPTLFLDIRPARATFPGLSEVAASLAALPFADGSLPSVSCLHVIEHVGLGRYGDPLDVEGTKRAAAELARVVRPGGDLYLSVPTGRSVTYFNAHRVHSTAEVRAMLPGLDLQSLSAVLDDGSYVDDPSPRLLDAQSYACGMFHFRRE